MELLRLRLVHDGPGPVYWSPAPGDERAFGLQDTHGMLHPGSAGPDGIVSFEFTLACKLGADGKITLSGDFAHGKAAARFIYLSWRQAAGNLAQRLKIPLVGVTADLVELSRRSGRPMTATLTDHEPRATRTGENVGGTRVVAWTV